MMVVPLVLELLGHLVALFPLDYLELLFYLWDQVLLVVQMNLLVLVNLDLLLVLGLLAHLVLRYHL